MDPLHHSTTTTTTTTTTSIQQNIIDLLDPTDMEYYLNDKSLAPLRKVPVCIAAAVYRMSAGNCMPYTNGNSDKLLLQDQNVLSLFNAYQRNESPWSNYKQQLNKHDHHDKSKAVNEDTSSNSSCSTLEDSTTTSCSSRSDSPEPKHHSNKKRSYHMLIREIRRLRGENALLRSSVSVLKNDLRDCTISRQNTDMIHQRTYEEFENRHVKLEQEVLVGQDEIKELKEQIEQLQLASSSCHYGDYQQQQQQQQQKKNKLTLHDAAYFKRNASFGCYEFDQEDDTNMNCQPLVTNESALPEVNIKMDHLEAEAGTDYFTRRFGGDNKMTPQDEQQQQDESDDDEEQEDEVVEPFEQVATSYIHQALIAKLSSARVRLEFDDLILKYEPTTDTILAVLAASFIHWIKRLLQQHQNDSVSKLFHTKIQAGIHDLWESILQCYTTEDEYQVILLNHIEDEAKQENIIVDHFDRLALMLYKYNVVDDDAVMTWWQTPSENDVSKKIRKVTSKFYDWVQDEEDGDDEESDDNEDEEQVYSDEDEHTGFSFTDSPIPELNDEEDDTFEFAHDPVQQEQQQQKEEALFLSQDACTCQLMTRDDDTSNKDMPCSSPPLPPLPPSPTTTTTTIMTHACLCDSKYTPPPLPVATTEKKKKSVRICDVNIQ